MTNDNRNSNDKRKRSDGPPRSGGPGGARIKPRDAKRGPSRSGGPHDGKRDGKRDGPARDNNRDGGQGEGKRDRSRPDPTKGLDSRCAALDLVERVCGGEPLEEALERTPAFTALTGSDRAFARALASTVLRRRGAIDHVISAFIDRPLPKKSHRVTDVLRLATAQSLLLGVPDHATVSTSVDLARLRRETAGYAKLINAVARKIAAKGPALLEKAPPRADTPAWMWRAWDRAYGPLRTRAIAQAHQGLAPLDLTIKDKNAVADYANRLDAEELSDQTIRLKKAQDVTSLEGFEAGDWWVQDFAAALPVRLLGDVTGKTVFDLCAAPGGKTMQLAARGARVIAVDRAEDRLTRLNENLRRVDLHAQTICADVLRWEPAIEADAILLDAPCSATGTLRRHPDIAWTKSETDIAALEALQVKMIDRVARFLKPGGLLIYCVCSLQREEGEAQAEAALARHNNFSRVPVTSDGDIIPEEAITRAGDLRSLPSMAPKAGIRGGMDGFFAVRLQKN